jgi:acetyltransferase-like isoleucine patch superfamily enzyme
MSDVYYRHCFGNFGYGSTIMNPRLICNSRCISVGDHTWIHTGAILEPILEYEDVSYSPKIEIGNDVYIGPNVHMATVGRLTIGDGSVLSENVYLNDTKHGFDPEQGLIMRQDLVHGGNITIGKNCFLGLRSAIMPGVTLGDHCVVGAGAVVTKSFPDYSMVAGVPAILVKRYSLEEKQWVRVE